MKDLIAGLVMTVVLIVVFSVVCIPEDLPGRGSFGTDYPGNSGMILPGGGFEPAEAVTRAEEHDTARQESASVSNEAAPEPHEEPTKEEIFMNDMLLVFWHGVAAVLIGESAALVVATACLAALTRKVKRQLGNHD